MSDLGGLQWIVLEDFGHSLGSVCVGGVNTCHLSGNCILLTYKGCFPLFYGSCAMSAHVAY